MTYSQIYYGEKRRISCVNENIARETLARKFGFDRVPPVGIEVDDNTDSSSFERFTGNKFGCKYLDIISHTINFSKTKIEVDEDFEFYMNPDIEEDIEYIQKYYSKELKDHLEKIGAVVVEELKPNPAPVVTKSSTINKETKNQATTGFPSGVAATHIPDNFLQPATPSNPAVVQKAKEVKPIFMTNIENRLKSTSQINTAGAIYAMYPDLKQVEDKIRSGGVLGVAYEMESGLIKMKVSSLEKPDEILDKYSMTFDLGGAVVTPGAKWWPGVNNTEPVDFMIPYKYNLKAIESYLNGEEVSEEYQVYNDGVAKLNKIVDLRSVFRIEGITDEDATVVMKNIKEATDKLATRLDKECKGIRFIIGAYTDKDNFELTTADTVYENVGGKVITPGAAVRVQIASKKAPKLLK